ncbi:MAG: hypothetical protein K8T25_10070 [Planctomycetia bacterium]|nr:hypothetical protein [Planctomycetia bacterium]
MTSPRFHFTLRQLFWATFLVAAGIAAWVFVCGHVFDEHLSTAAGITLVFAGYFGFIAPFAAIGGLVGKSIKPSRLWVLVGVGTMVAYAIGFAMVILFRFPRTY